MIRIAIVEDNERIRTALKSRLESYNDLEILFTSSDGKEFLESMRESRKNIMPDVVLMDLDMPVMNGIEAIYEGKRRYPTVKFLVLTIFDEDEKIFNAIRSGADGYLLKDEPVEKIKEAVENLMKGESAPLSPSIARKVLNLLSAAPDASVFSGKEEKFKNLDEYRLTEREKEILELLVSGMEYKEIAEQLGISPNTVRNCISKIYRKLHVNSSTQAARIFRGEDY